MLAHNFYFLLTFFFLFRPTTFWQIFSHPSKYRFWTVLAYELCNIVKVAQFQLTRDRVDMTPSWPGTELTWDPLPSDLGKTSAVRVLMSRSPDIIACESEEVIAQILGHLVYKLTRTWVSLFPGKLVPELTRTLASYPSWLVPRYSHTRVDSHLGNSCLHVG